MTHFKTPKTKPVSIRLTAEERALLERRAGSLGLSTFIRNRLFEDGAEARRPRGRFPVKDQQALAQVLAFLGKAGLAANVAELAKAMRVGTLPVSEETETALQVACADIAAIKVAVMRALGIQER
ncbi:hypothetical protein HNS03_08530 [Amorphus sp. 3PC139-8]